jgi:hypothetical protein
MRTICRLLIVAAIAAATLPTVSIPASTERYLNPHTGNWIGSPELSQSDINFLNHLRKHYERVKTQKERAKEKPKSSPPALRGR